MSGPSRRGDTAAAPAVAGAGRRGPAALGPLDWGAIANLRLQARVVAEGLYAGGHRSLRRGSGVEFGGHRAYVPGDDLRFLDRRSLLKHDRLVVREFETDTERALWLCLDATASMGFRGARAPAAKLAFAALVAAALARVAVAGTDPVGLVWLGGARPRDLPAGAGGPAFERIVDSLSAAGAAGDLEADRDALRRTLVVLGRRARRGSVVVLLSDLLDLPEGAERLVGALGTGGRVLVAVQVLDPSERDLDFVGKVRLRALEGPRSVETDVDAVRREYQARLEAHTEAWSRALSREGGRLVRAVTTDRAVIVVRQVLQVVAEARR
ncbi:MAG: DUF58 domain-containing protein [Polyangiaceae bacterium]|nr:DUF58 domain-containing protein [Polyangiaceae bacterium]